MDIINLLNNHYPISFDTAEIIRDAGSTSYAVLSGGDKYFLRAVKPAFFDTALTGAEIQAFLYHKGFPAPRIVYTTENTPYYKTDNMLLILYEFIEGSESNPEQDAEAIGELAGQLHLAMKNYPGLLVKRDKHFYIGRYIDMLRKRKYHRAEEFYAYGETLWNNIKDLPRGFCHGDMYCGNILKTPGGRLLLLDFDTSCEGFPMYDPALICDMTEYFNFEHKNFSRSKEVFSRFLPEYTKYCNLSEAEIQAFFDLIAVQHFATQATVMEIFGSDCLSVLELDYQLEWLYRWREQYGNAQI